MTTTDQSNVVAAIVPAGAAVQPEPLSSCEIADQATGPPRITAKAYHADPLEAARLALAMHAAARRELDRTHSADGEA